MTDRWKLVLLMICAVMTLALGEVTISRGMKQSGEEAGWWSGVRLAIANRWVIAGVLLLAVHLGLYATAMSKADLSLVMPITAAAYPLVTILSRFALHEDVNLARWIGTSVIAAGVAVVAWAEG